MTFDRFVADNSPRFLPSGLIPALQGKRSPSIDRDRSPDALRCNLDPDWAIRVSRLDFAFQPIVNVHSGICFAYEALLRCVDRAGFPSIEEFFDACYRSGVLPAVEERLREMATAKFAEIPHHRRMKLFLNIDNRAIDSLRRAPQRVENLLARRDISDAGLVLEISERHPLHENGEVLAALKELKKHYFNLAIDDFGTGFSGLKLLYAAEPEFVKVDRFFINNIGNDGRKRLLLEHIVSIAHLLGIKVIAEGVETDREFFICKDIGIDLAQGYLIQKPTTSVPDLLSHYPEVESLSRRERRQKTGDLKFIVDQIDAVDPTSADSDILDIIKRFREDRGRRFFPVVDGFGDPVGIVRDQDLKEYTYSLYGKDLLSNPSYGKKVRDFVARCPIADVNSRAERILEVFSAESDSEGVIIVDNMRYVGMLNTTSLLRVINEKNLAVARDQNPLTKLPGNTLISEYLSDSLADTECRHCFVYFDFDQFKPFNDKFGFRQGDRAILMFADILRKELLPAGASFVGHIGGDDFFAAFRDMRPDLVEAMARSVMESFAEDAESLYDPESRAAGYTKMPDRDGNMRAFPLLTVSAAMVEAPPGRRAQSPEEVSALIAALKKEAKRPGVGFAAASLTGIVPIHPCRAAAIRSD